MDTHNLGQLLMIGLAGPALSKKEKRFLKEVRPAGVIYFRRNVDSPRRLAALSSSVRRQLRADSPPLIGIDQEGGRVARLGLPFTVFPGNDFLGRAFRRSGVTTLARVQAAAMAAELRSVGINLNFTPVADIDTNPRNPIIGSRAFGENAKIVSTLVSATVRAYRKAGVVSCAKHFPGHGDTHADSHKVLPVVKASKATLLKRELAPFRAAVRAGVPTMMTAHVIYTALDRASPATTSPRILSLLRKNLRFRGVLISDDLEMNAIAKHQSIPDAAVEAIAAGVDLLLVCKSLSLAGAVYRRLQKAVRTGELSEARVNEALSRVRALKQIYLSQKPMATARRFGWPRHQKLARRIEHLGA